MQQNDLHPDEVLAALKRSASTRGQKTLDLIHGICKEQHASGIHDYSISTVGRVSKERGGLTEQALRNKDGERYRALLAAWVSHADGLIRKIPIKAKPGLADDVLGLIADARVRALVGSFLAENRKLKAENTLLKSQANVVIDRRPSHVTPAQTSINQVQAFESLSMLSPIEIEALQHAISDELTKRMGWTIDPKTGRVKAGSVTIFRPGYVKAIQKVLVAANVR